MVHNWRRLARGLFQAWLRLLAREQAHWDGEKPDATPLPRPERERPEASAAPEEPGLADLIQARNEERKHRASPREKDD